MTIGVRSATGNIQFDPAEAEGLIAEKRIGERIKQLRVKSSMSLVELGRHTGLSASFLSQLQTGRVLPTVRNLARIAAVFNEDLSYFFETEPQMLFRIHRKKERVRLPQSGVDDPTYYFESLGYMVPDRFIDPYYAEFLPMNRDVDVRPHMHFGYEFLYLLEGELEIRHADKVDVLQAGDDVYFDANTPHSYRCVSKTPAISIIVTMHQRQLSQFTVGLQPVHSPVRSKQFPTTKSISEQATAAKPFVAPRESQHQNRVEGGRPLKKYQHSRPSHAALLESI